MALVTTAAAAVVFRTGNDQFEIYFRRNRTLQGLPEAGPTGAAVELRLRGEQRLIATGAVAVSYTHLTLPTMYTV